MKKLKKTAKMKKWRQWERTIKCYLELDPSPGDVIVLGAFFDRDFACTFE